MPNRKRVRRFDSAVFAATLAVAMLGLAMTASVAAADWDDALDWEQPATSCEPGPTHQAFSVFGDSYFYYLAPGGDFEGSLTWSRTGRVSLVHRSGLESIGLLGDLTDLLGDSSLFEGLLGESSLGMLKDSRVTTPMLCVTSETPHLRFLARAARGSGQLDAEVRVYNSRGRVTDSSSGSISPSDHRLWRPTRFIDLKTDQLDPGETAYVDMRIRSQGNWLIDDVFIDPYRRG